MRKIEQFLVRIFGSEESLPSGCGFLVDNKNSYIITCCHVINDALKRNSRNKPDEIVYIDFPFLDKNQLLQAETKHWHYDPEDMLNDIAVLQLLDSLPDSVRSAPMIQRDDYSGDSFRAFGFPRGFEDTGREIKGVLGARRIDGRIQAEGISQFGYFFEQGFSGTPIWNSDRDGVSGMAFQIDMPEEAKVASIIPAELIIKALPGSLETPIQKTHQVNKLTLPQLEAARDPNRLVRVTAAPGTGKSLVIEERVRWLLSQGIDPDTIAVVSFTRAASRDLRDRIVNFCKSHEVNGADGVSITTLHSLAMKVLRKSNSLVDYSSNPQVLDQ